ncbi:hypothetical protein [Litorilituus sediminis]|uniref:Uncharacterized protein n=1 Tax=Litorilituus sediminis TaxID=718192 RepID=A0A4P6PBT0_9GAMM|nr:hypothetical protein [Litorilituus sediminis]QBG37185.1 hypothetical protein EMK97_16330 [Litorilituus sediminis]
MKKILLALLLFNSSVYAGTGMIKECHNCSESQYKLKAESVVKPQKVYIIDMVKGNLRAYNVKKVIVDEYIEETQATLISSTSEENSSYNNLKANRASYISSVRNDYPSDDINFNQLLSNEPLSYSPSEVTAYQFIQDSSKRRDVYRRMQVAYPTLMNLTNSWNSFVTVMSFNLTSRIAAFCKFECVCLST